MSSEAFRTAAETVEFSLRTGERLVFGPTSVRHPAALDRLAPVTTRYEDVTHVSISHRTLRIGTRKSVYILQRRDFRSDGDAERFTAELARRVATAPGGEARLAAMRGIDLRAARATRQWATFALVGLCVVGMLLQWMDDPGWRRAGEFSASLVGAGEWWRLVTANLLHAMPFLPIHFALNTLGLLALGALLEWSIGSARTVLVMAVAGIGAMAAAWWVEYEQALGASGIVMGVFGALVFLELRHGGELPAHWRLPRAVIWAGIALQAGIELLAWAVFPIIATGAHVGGFLSGFAICALVGAAGLERRPVRRALRLANGVAAVVLVLAVGGAVSAYRAGPDWERYAGILLARETASPAALNDVAWLMVTTNDSPSEAELDAALALAERAVETSGRRSPNILDTLAEVHFQRGETAEALTAIEEAIALDPDEAYYRGQRERFLGERDADDRPDPPAPPGRPPRRGPLDPQQPEFAI